MFNKKDFEQGVLGETRESALPPSDLYKLNCN